MIQKMFRFSFFLSFFAFWSPLLTAQTPFHADGYEVEAFPAIGGPMPAWADKKKKLWPIWALSFEGKPRNYGTFQGLGVFLVADKDGQSVVAVRTRDEYFRTPEGFDMCTELEDILATEGAVVEISTIWHLLFVSLTSGWKVYFEHVKSYGYRIHYFYNGVDPISYPLPE